MKNFPQDQISAQPETDVNQGDAVDHRKIPQDLWRESCTGTTTEVSPETVPPQGQSDLQEEPLRRAVQRDRAIE